ncbi:MAG: helicase-related protein [Caldilineaceae bacterium]|nr:helicase-related protein [Caldilineaceae bacterium]
MSLRSLDLQRSYTPDNCDSIIGHLYVPTLAQAVRYDRTTYTFSMAGLVEAAAGLAGLVNNQGRIRLICDQQMEPKVVRAILDGHAGPETELLHRVDPSELVTGEDLQARGDLDLLTWLVKRRQMEIQVAICERIFHPKMATITDAAGDWIALQGSNNESIQGWDLNYESCSVFTSWQELERAQDVQDHFDLLWANRSKHARVIPVPKAYREQLIQAAPRQRPTIPVTPPTPAANEYWNRIAKALRDDPHSTPATIPIKLWPHQERLRAGLVAHPRFRKLIADEVGLGKTIQAGIMMKTRLNADPDRRCLVIAPRAVLNQWQDELRHYLNIDFPVLDRLGHREGLVYADGTTEPSSSQPWEHRHLIVSYQWLRLHVDSLPADTDYWGTVIADEAHHARAETHYLKLLRHVTRCTQDLLLLTATPMQLHEDELYTLLNVLEPNAPQEGLAEFYRDSTPDQSTWLELRAAYRAAFPEGDKGSLAWVYRDNDMFIRSRTARSDDRHSSAQAMRTHYRQEGLMSRNTRTKLRQYGQHVATRNVEDIPIAMEPPLRMLYDEIDDLARKVYRDSIDKGALGFVMTVFRTRLSSSLPAYVRTLQATLEKRRPQTGTMNFEDAWDVENWDEVSLPDAADMRALHQALQAATGLSSSQDRKLNRLLAELASLRLAGHRRIIIFTRFTDTQSYIEQHLPQQVPAFILNGRHTAEARRETVAKLRDSKDACLLATEAAGESLNLQSCSAVVNYDIPWNPMRLEQRIGRVDRIGQEHDEIAVVNLFYEGTVEYDAYRAVRERLDNIEGQVGVYGAIVAAAAASSISKAYRDPAVASELRETLARLPFEQVPDIDWAAEPRPQPTNPVVTMADLETPLNDAKLLPDSWNVEARGGSHWRLERPGCPPCIVTTDRVSFDYARERLDWWGPGHPAFDTALRQFASDPAT